MWIGVWMVLIWNGVGISFAGAGEARVLGPSQAVVAIAGDDVTLPCWLTPATDAASMNVEWSRPGLAQRYPYVHVLQDGREVFGHKIPSYRHRTALFVEELSGGNISLRLSRVRLSDEGEYRCLAPTLRSSVLIQLVVGAVAQPVISIVGPKGSGGVVLQCESKGWYPEPEMSWLDSDGEALPAGATETVRDPDGLYTVRGNVTVTKTPVTCRVHQRRVNQTTSAPIHIPEAVLKPETSVAGLTAGIVVTVILLVILVVLLGVFTCRRKRKKKAIKNGEGDIENMTISITSDGSVESVGMDQEQARIVCLTPTMPVDNRASESGEMPIREEEPGEEDGLVNQEEDNAMGGGVGLARIRSHLGPSARPTSFLLIPLLENPSLATRFGNMPQRSNSCSIKAPIRIQRRGGSLSFKVNLEDRQPLAPAEVELAQTWHAGDLRHGLMPFDQM